MASAWGTSWGTTWLDTWATGSVVVPPPTIDYQGGGAGWTKKRRRKQEELFDKLELTMRELVFGAINPKTLDRIKPDNAIIVQSKVDDLMRCMEALTEDSKLRARFLELRKDFVAFTEAVMLAREMEDEDELIMMQ